MTEGLTARFAAKVGRLAIDVELDTAGGTLALVGPNGAGKTSVLSALLGIVPIQHGRIAAGGHVLVDTARGIAIPVEQRRLAYIPQDYALFPHLSVRENVAFAVLSASGRHSTQLVDAALERLGVGGLAERHVPGLSGGEKQRVALARACHRPSRATPR